MKLNFLSNLTPQQIISEKVTPGQDELMGFLHMMVAGQGKNADEFVKEVRSVVDPEFLKRRQAKARSTQWLAVAKPGDETDAVLYGRKVRLKVMEGLIKEADVSDVLVALGLDTDRAMFFMNQFDVEDIDYNLSALRQALRRAGGDPKNAVSASKEAETGKPATPIVRPEEPREPRRPIAPRMSAQERLASLRQGSREVSRLGQRTSTPRFTPSPAAPPMGSSAFYSRPNV